MMDLNPKYRRALENMLEGHEDALVNHGDGPNGIPNRERVELEAAALRAVLDAAPQRVTCDKVALYNVLFQANLREPDNLADLHTRNAMVELGDDQAALPLSDFNLSHTLVEAIEHVLFDDKSDAEKYVAQSSRPDDLQLIEGRYICDASPQAVSWNDSHGGACPTCHHMSSSLIAFYKGQPNPNPDLTESDPIDAEISESVPRLTANQKGILDFATMIMNPGYTRTVLRSWIDAETAPVLGQVIETKAAPCNHCRRTDGAHERWCVEGSTL
jgi:hypothetical protein